MKTLTCFEKRNALIPLCSFIFLSLTFLSVSLSNSQTWYPLGSGTNGNVYASTILNNNLIIAGDFTSAGGVTVNHIAQWNGITWSPVGSGTDSTVYALTVFNGKLIAAGKFINAGGVNCNRIANWNGTNWTSLGLGLNDIAYALAVFGGSLRVGGSFTNAGGVPCNHITRWDGNSWFPMGFGVDDAVYALTLYGADLILVGKFTNSAGIFTLRRVADYNINGFYTPLGNGIDSGTANSAFVYNGSLFVGGNFTSIGSIPVFYIARWNGVNWNTVTNGTNGGVYSLCSFNNNLIAGGIFTNASGTPANHIASWDGTNWSSIGNGMSGGNTNVNTLIEWSNLLVAGGSFSTAGGVSASNVAAYGSVPVAPTLINPCSTQNDSLTPLLTWNSVSNAATYGVQVSLDPNFGAIILNVNMLPVTQYQIAPGLLSYSTTYFWRANASNGLGSGPWSLICYFSTANPTGISNNHEIPKQFKLYQNYPNPFNPKTIIKYQLPIHNNVKLVIFDLLGREVATLVNEKQNAGTYQIEWDSEDYPSGIYFYKIVAGNYVQSDKMILIK